VIAAYVYNSPDNLHKIVKNRSYIEYPAEAKRPPVGEEINQYRNMYKETAAKAAASGASTTTSTSTSGTPSPAAAAAPSAPSAGHKSWWKLW
jgi:hypothetical protein